MRTPIPAVLSVLLLLGGCEKEVPLCEPFATWGLPRAQKVESCSAQGLVARFLEPPFQLDEVISGKLLAAGFRRAHLRSNRDQVTEPMIFVHRQTGQQWTYHSYITTELTLTREPTLSEEEEAIAAQLPEKVRSYVENTRRAIAEARATSKQPPKRCDCAELLKLEPELRARSVEFFAAASSPAAAVPAQPLWPMLPDASQTLDHLTEKERKMLSNRFQDYVEQYRGRFANRLVMAYELLSYTPPSGVQMSATEGEGYDRGTKVHQGTLVPGQVAVRFDLVDVSSKRVLCSRTLEARSSSTVRGRVSTQSEHPLLVDLANALRFKMSMAFPDMCGALRFHETVFKEEPIFQ